MKNKTVVVRADGSREIGTGHIFRCLALARFLRSRGHDVIFFMRDLPGAPKQRLAADNFRVVVVPDVEPFDNEIPFILEHLKANDTEWIIIDHYDVKESYYQRMKDAGAKVLAIDDINHTKFPVDILVNQNPLARGYSYDCLDRTVQLLGPGYAIVHHVYQQKRPEARVRRALERILIFLGGGDPYNLTLKVLKDVCLYPQPLSLDVVVGTAYQFENEVRRFLGQGENNMNLYKDLPDLSDLILRADIGIGAGGSVTWEMFTLKLPLIAVPFADNQVDVALGIEQLGAGIYIKDYRHENNPVLKGLLARIKNNSELERMSQKAAQVCDGRGLEKIYQTLTSFEQ